MATTSVILDIRANTSKALGEFKRFSSQLDNKFLISGLKLDVVRNALSQINREFQKAIGEQGLAAGSSLKAAENQAALLTQTFKGFSSQAAKAITADISSALNKVAVTAGGTMEDVKKTIAATPFISTSLSEELRKKMGEGILSFQRDIRRAGISDEFGNFAQQFLSGQAGALELINSGKPLESFLGAQIAQRAGTVGQVYDPKQRSEILKSIIEDPALQTQLRELALETSGYKIFLEDLNTALFNPRAGIFGSLREVTMGIGDKTNIFRETNSLVESIFGRQGLFVNFFKQIGKIFGLEDPLKVIISGVRFLTRQFNELNKFVQSPAFQGIVNAIKDVFGRIKNFTEKLYAQVTEDWENPESIVGRVRSIGEGVGRFFSGIYDTIQGGAWEPKSITESIRGIGSSVREFVKTLGETIRGEDVSDEAKFGSSILGTLVSEIGKTAVTVFAELGKTIVNKVPEIAAQVIPALGTAIVDAIKGSFEQGPLEGAIAAALAGGAGIFALRKLGGVVGGGRAGVNAFLGSARNQQTGGVPGQLNRFLGSPFGPALGRGVRAGAAASDLGSSSTFYRQVIFYLSKLSACVCGPGGLGGGRDIDINADTPEARRERARTRRGPTGPSMPRRAPLTSIDTANPYAYSRGAYLPEPDTRSSYLKMQREARRNAIKGASSSKYFDLYTESLGGVSGPFSNLGPDERGLMASKTMEAPDALDRQERVRQRYNQRFGRRARFTRAFRGLDRRAIIASSIGDMEEYQTLEAPDELTRQERVRQRYNRRFGGRARLGRAFRGFGKGALIAGGIGLAGAALFGGGGSAQAAEMDPATGQPKVGAGEAFGRVGMGAAEGALTGAMFGPWGAAIGGVIGGGVALLDKGVRDAIGKFISEAASNFMKMGGDLVDGLRKNVLGAFDRIKSFAGGIDWKTVLINALIPGGNATIQGLQGIAQFASKLNIFDSMKAGIDSIRGFVSKILDGFKSNPATGWLFRETGGPVTPGTSYVVGERGPEIFTPGQTGTISTNRELMTAKSSGASSSVSANFNIAINVNGGMAPGDVEALRAPVLAIIEQAWAQASTGTSSRGSVAV